LSIKADSCKDVPGSHAFALGGNQLILVDPGLGGPTPAMLNVKRECHMKQTSSSNQGCGCTACISTILNEIASLVVLTF